MLGVDKLRDVIRAGRTRGLDFVILEELRKRTGIVPREVLKADVEVVRHTPTIAPVICGTTSAIWRHMSSIVTTSLKKLQGNKIRTQVRNLNFRKYDGLDFLNRLPQAKPTDAPDKAKIRWKVVSDEN